MSAGDPDKMTTSEPRQKLGPGPSRTPSAAERAAYEARERNREHFETHVWELQERYPDHWFLIYAEQVVEAFADPMDCIDRRDALDEDVQATHWVGHPRQPAIWIL